MTILRKSLHLPALAVLAAAALAACSGAKDAAGPGAPPAESSPLPDTATGDPVNPGPVSRTTDVLLFNGVGISTSDWQTTEQIVRSAGLSYQLVNSAQLNAMPLDTLGSFGLLLFPGGYGNQITNALSASTRIKVRQAVRERGVSFLGICAGAWVAVGPEPAAGAAAPYGFAIATGAILKLYLPGGREPTAAMVETRFADGTERALVWWGGPETPEWNGGVVARYENGAPAISQTFAGKGLVVVSGPHPEAPLGWRATAGTDRDGLDYDVALRLIKAALERQPLPAF